MQLCKPGGPPWPVLPWPYLHAEHIFPSHLCGALRGCCNTQRSFQPLPLSQCCLQRCQCSVASFAGQNCHILLVFCVCKCFSAGTIMPLLRQVRPCLSTPNRCVSIESVTMQAFVQVPAKHSLEVHAWSVVSWRAKWVVAHLTRSPLLSVRHGLSQPSLALPTSLPQDLQELQTKNQDPCPDPSVQLVFLK